MEGDKEGQFFKVDSTAITLREYLWGGNPISALFGWVISKIFRVRLPSSVDDLNVISPSPFQVPRESLPEEIRKRFEPMELDLARSGFRHPVYYAIEDSFHSTKIYQAAFLHESGQTFARVHYRHWSMPMPPKEYLFTLFISAFTDDTMLVSTSGHADMLAPPQCRVNRKEKSSVTDLWNSHLSELHKESKSSHFDQGPEGLPHAIERHHVLHRDFHQKRGVFKSLSEEDLRIARLRNGSAAPAAAPTNSPPPLPPPLKQPSDLEPAPNAGAESDFVPNPENAPILAEMGVLQNKAASSWMSGLILLAVSAGLFVSAGAWRWSVELALLFVPILLFHEFGHYVAMKTFDYRNLKMFFIPLFGAAVSGTHYNVPGWKKVIVSLAGPVPGILVGIIMAVAGLVWDIDLLLKAASLTLILNGLNLLPILPLDGGWVVHAVLFSRNYLMETAFRAVTAVGLLVGSALLGDRILMFLGIFMVIGLMPTVKMAKITHGLRKKGIAGAAAEDQSIPSQTADAIITEVRTSFPSNLTVKQGAEFTLQIFESLNARPPGVGLSLVFLTTQVIAFAAAIVFGATAIVGQSGRLGDFMRLAADTPQYTYQSGSLVTWEGPDASYTNSLNTRTIVANFEDAEDAATEFQNLTNGLSAHAAARLFGHTILVATRSADAEERSTVFQQLEAATKDVFVPGTNTYWGFAASMIVPSEEVGKQMDEEFQPFFAAAAINHWLIPPWHPNDPRTAEEIRAHQTARYTYHRIINRYDYEELNEEPEEDKIHEEISQASRRGDDAKLKELTEELQRRTDAERKAFYDDLRADTNGVDLNVIRDYSLYESQLRSTNGSQYSLLQAVVSNMGTVAMNGKQPAPGAGQFSSTGGDMEREGFLAQFRWIRFQNPFVGTKAFADWVSSNNIPEMNYSFNSSTTFMEE